MSMTLLYPEYRNFPSSQGVQIRQHLAAAVVDVMCTSPFQQPRLAGHADADASSPDTPLTGGGVLGNGVEAASYKATAVATFQEFLSSNDGGEVSSALGELQQPHLAHIFVKQVMRIARSASLSSKF